MCCFTATVISCLTLPKITYSVCHVRTGNTPLPPSSFPPPSIFAAIYSHTVLSHSTYGNLKLYQKRQDREKGVCVWCTNLPHLYMLSELKFNYCHTENKKCSQFSQNMFVTYHGCTAVCEFPRRISPHQFLSFRDTIPTNASGCLTRQSWCINHPVVKHDCYMVTLG